MAEVNINSSVIIREGNSGRSYIDTLNKLKSGYTPAEFDLLMEKDVMSITSQAVAAITSIGLTGMSDANTNNGLLYGSITGTTNSTVTIFKDAARSASVATGSVVRSAGGTVTLAEANSSGISGTCVIIADAVNATDQVFTVRKELSRYNRDNLTGQSVKGLVAEVVAGSLNLYSTPLVAKFDGVGCDNVDGVFERDAMAKAALVKNIELV